MIHDDLQAEAAFYLRKIGALENWFVFVLSKGYLQLVGGEREKYIQALRMPRPPAIPTVRALRTMDKHELIDACYELSRYAEHLDAARLNAFKRNLCPSIFRFAIATLMEKIERREEVQNWMTPFTCGMGDVEQVFGVRN